MGSTRSDWIPVLAMVVMQGGYAGMNITSKLSIQSGMNPLVLVAYRQLFATAFIAPFAFWFEWKTVRKMTMNIMCQILVCSLIGVTGNQILYFVGLKYSTPTIAVALTNLLPAFTFILAVLFRQECVRMKTKAGQAMVIGTIVGVGGALFLSFYHGKTLNLGQSGIHWEYAQKQQASTTSTNKSNFFLGSLFITTSALFWALWFIMQANLCKKYPGPYMSTTYMCLMSSIQCVVIALCFEHTPSAWSLTNPMRLISALYAGVVCTGVACCVMTWTIERKGALYVTAFSPLQLIITAMLSWAVLEEKLYLGTVVGSVLIVLGLYSVLWGKSKEKEREGIHETEDTKEKDAKNDLELQIHNWNHDTIQKEQEEEEERKQDVIVVKY